MWHILTYIVGGILSSVYFTIDYLKDKESLTVNMVIRITFLTAIRVMFGWMSLSAAILHFLITNGEKICEIWNEDIGGKKLYKFKKSVDD